MTPPANAVRLIGHQRRFAESIAQIDTELEFASGVVVAARRDEVVAAARAAYGPSEDFRGVRDAWEPSSPTASTAWPDWPRPSAWRSHPGSIQTVRARGGLLRSTEYSSISLFLKR